MYDAHGFIRKFFNVNGTQSEEIIKTHQMRPEWVTLCDELEKAGEAFAHAEKVMEAKKALFWKTVERDLKQYSNAMRYNQKTNEIEELARSRGKFQLKGVDNT